MNLPKSSHATAVGLIAEALRGGGFRTGFSIRGQMLLTLDDDSEPDVAVVKGTFAITPTTTQAALS